LVAEVEQISSRKRKEVISSRFFSFITDSFHKHGVTVVKKGEILYL